MRRLVLLALVVLAGGLSVACVSEGQGWRLSFGNNFVIEYTQKPNSVGEFYQRTSFDQEGWSVLGPLVHTDGIPNDGLEGPPAPAGMEPIR